MLTITKEQAKQFEVCCGKQTTKHVNTYYTPEFTDEHEYRCMVCHQHKTVSVKKDLDEVKQYREWLNSLKSN